MMKEIKAVLKQKLRAADTNIVVEVVIALLVLAILFPIAMQQIVQANTSGWNSAVSVVFTVLAPVLAIIAVALLFFHAFRLRHER